VHLPKEIIVELTGRNVDEFLATLDGPAAESIRALDGIIAEVFAGLARELWEGVFWGGTEQSIIGYGHTVQTRPGKPTVEWFAVGLAQQKNHISVYVNAADADGYLVQAYKGRLGRVKVGSAALTFASVDALDLEVFRALLQDAARLTPDAT
jgi:hypothetical protein